MVSYDKGVSIRFFLPLKHLQKHNLSSGRFMLPSGYQVLDWFFAFLEIMDWFNKISMVF